MSKAKTYELNDNLTVEFGEHGAYITGPAINANLDVLGVLDGRTRVIGWGSATVFLPWAALDALDDARYEHNLPFADLPPEGEK